MTVGVDVAQVAQALQALTVILVRAHPDLGPA
eukprot:CAMPEP_0204574508 /NCGR_PEP_ID=MMETSP0661-20131031/40648_1 /ASSEMBLY_ACC=CAM_ASM_000606 /TAXON_ID=109239 /ORGANISM="Alexandrium margalefi, Strain AMGDE01CS-322" /LENGTH=31 /DNA_ID= /DNA_START= /DNA_END= /DNA_ORIENTATION=